MHRLGVLCLLALLLGACGDSGEKPESAPRAASQEAPLPTGTAPPAEAASANGIQPELAIPEEEPPTPAQVAVADRILAWNNKVQDILARGALADKIATCADFYKETWRLPRRPRGAYVRDFAPAPGLIKGQSARMIDEFLATMDKASDDMLAAYGKLEKYVQDPAIQDDGKLGRELAAQVTASHLQYLAARKSFMAIVEQKTQEAEDLLLRGHPLKRQIRLSQSMFAQFREIGDLLATGTPEPELLRAYGENLQKLIVEAGKPPFPASPSYERLYRQFLRQAEIYASVLRRGLTEGFHGVQKRELLHALNACREGYNAFAAAINENS